MQLKKSNGTLGGYKFIIMGFFSFLIGLLVYLVVSGIQLISEYG